MTALPAFVTSRTASRAGAFAMFAALADAGFAEAGVLEARFDARTAAAEQRLRDTCADLATADHLSACVREADDSFHAAWQAMSTGDGASPIAHNSGQQEEQLLFGVPRCPGLQRRLCRIVDKE